MSISHHVQATPAKLPSGEWGARSKSVVCQGCTITIVARSGKSWNAVVAAVLPGGLLETRSAEKTSKPSKPARRRTPRDGTVRGGCGYPGCNGRNYCDECTDT